MSADNTENREMILVPREPTREMIDAAYEAALDENAESVWHTMIETWIAQSRKGNSRFWKRLTSSLLIFQKPPHNYPASLCGLKCFVLIRLAHTPT